MRTRDSAGWIRMSSESKSSPPSGRAMTTSPSTMKRASAPPRASSGASSSGKYRFSGLRSRDWRKTDGPSRKAMARNPSHFGS